MRPPRPLLALFIAMVWLPFQSRIAGQSPEWIKNHILDHGRYYEGLVDEPNGAVSYFPAQKSVLGGTSHSAVPEGWF